MNRRGHDEVALFALFLAMAAIAVAGLLELSGCTGLQMGRAADAQAAEMERAK